MTRGTSPDHYALLRRLGLHVTAPRPAVPRAVSLRPHGTADDVDSVARAESGAASRWAGHDALAPLGDNHPFATSTDRGEHRRV